MMKFYKKLILTLAVGIILGGALLICVFLLPTDTIEKSVKNGIEILEEEGISGYVLIDSSGTRLDNYTDAIMLGCAAFQKINASVLEKAVMIYYPKSKELNPFHSAIAYYKNDLGMGAESYSRYWHGYLTILKPLLIFFEYQEIRILNIILQSIFVLLSLCLMIKRKLYKIIFPFIIVLLFLYPPVIPLSLQYSTVFYICIIAINILLYKYEFIQSKIGFFHFFLILGMITSYFDFLTYPLLTLGIPLCFVIFQTNEEEYIKRTKLIITLSFMWGLGYIAMWGGKWIFGSILLQKNLLQDAFEAVQQRAGWQQDTEVISYFEVIRRNLSVYANGLGIFLIGVVIVRNLLLAVKEKTYYITKIKIVQMIPWVLLSSMPFIWYMVTGNHSYIHFGFTYRVLVISIFAGQCMLVELFCKGKGKTIC